MHKLIIDRNHNADTNQRTCHYIAWIMVAEIDARSRRRHEAETGPQQPAPSRQQPKPRRHDKENCRSVTGEAAPVHEARVEPPRKWRPKSDAGRVHWACAEGKQVSEGASHDNRKNHREK